MAVAVMAGCWVSAFMKSGKILRADNLVITQPKGGVPPGNKPQLHPLDLTYSTLLMWWMGLGEMVWRRVVGYVGLDGDF
jgi:hypothetical protein